MSAIASATSSQYFQAVPSTTKADSTLATAQQAPATSVIPSANTVVESVTTKNSDGTFGPKHLKINPGSIPSAQPQASGPVTSVDIHA
jgi:hypothetical protein